MDKFILSRRDVCKFNISHVYYLIWLMAILIKRRPQWQYRKVLVINFRRRINFS